MADQDDQTAGVPGYAVFDQLKGYIPANAVEDYKEAAQILPLVKNLLQTLFGSRASVVDENGQYRSISSKAGEGLLPGYIRQMEADARNRMYRPEIYQHWAEQRDTLLRNWFSRVKGWTPERVENTMRGSGFYFEKIAANLMLHGATQAGETLGKFLQRQGIGTRDGGNRRQQAMASVGTELYKMATDLSNRSYWKGVGGPNQSLQAMLAVLEQGGFRELYRTPGMFDASGKLTTVGQYAVQERANNMGKSVIALKRLTGKDNAIDILKEASAPEAFGYKLLTQLDDPGVAAELNKTRHLMMTSGLEGKPFWDMLKYTRRQFGSDDIRPMLAAMNQMAGFEGLAGSMSMSGDPEVRGQLIAGAVSAAARSPLMKAASISAAALETKYGKDQAWAIVDATLAQGEKNPQTLIRRVNAMLPGSDKITSGSVMALLQSPSAYEYFRSGHATPYAVSERAGSMARWMLQNNSWARAHLPTIMQQEGRLDRESVAAYLQTNGATPKQQGQVMANLDQWANYYGQQLGIPNLGADEMLSFMNLGALHDARNTKIQNSADIGKQMADYDNRRNAIGGEAASQVLYNAQGPMSWIDPLMAAVTGTDATMSPQDTGGLWAQEHVEKTPQAGAFNTATGESVYVERQKQAARAQLMGQTPQVPAQETPTPVPAPAPAPAALPQTTPPKALDQTTTKTEPPPPAAPPTQPTTPIDTTPPPLVAYRKPKALDTGMT